MGLYFQGYFSVGLICISPVSIRLRNLKSGLGFSVKSVLMSLLSKVGDIGTELLFEFLFS